MNVVLLSRYGRLGSSSRLRFYQYINYLETRGIVVTTAPLLDDSYVANLYAGRSTSPAKIAWYYGRSIAWLLKSGNYDLVWIEKEVFPFLPALAEKILCLLKKPYIVDYDDAVFHAYDMHHNRLIRLLLGSKIDNVLKNAALVTVGNDYLAERAAHAGAARIEFLPTVIDLERYTPANRSACDLFTIGWIGSPATCKYLRILEPVFRTFCAQNTVRLLFIGINDAGFNGVPAEFREWSEDTEANSIRECDVGIMPLVDEPWERGKCGYKLIQYMACGLPVIASPVGINRRIIDHGETGFLADDDSSWLSALTMLMNDYRKRITMGQAGRRKVEEQYCRQVTAPRLADLMLSVAHPVD
jgi:glycosyltransferase involved in cell wall biosynthesis